MNMELILKKLRLVLLKNWRKLKAIAKLLISRGAASKETVKSSPRSIADRECFNIDSH